MTALQNPPIITEVQAAILDDQPRKISSRTVDDVASLIGSLIGSLAIVWVCFEQILAFSGVVGFAVAWWMVFTLMYMGLTALSNPWPAVKDRAAATIVTSGALIVAAVIVWVIVYPIYKGWPALHHWNFYNQDMSATRDTAPLNQGGIRAAIVGTAEQVGIATAISLPLGVATAIYLAEVGGRAARVVRTVVEAMTALPDILAALFVLAFLILGLGWQKDGFAVAVALSVTMTPIVARSAEVVLRVVPAGLREASWALGASTWSTVWRVVLPTARAGLATSLILGVARVAGETAPLLIVDQDSRFWNANPFKGAQASLPYFTYHGIHTGEGTAKTRAYGAATVLLVLVLTLFVIARLISRDRVRGVRNRRFAFWGREPQPPAADPLSPFPVPAPGEYGPVDEEPPDPPHWDLPDQTAPLAPIPGASQQMVGPQSFRPTSNDGLPPSSLSQSAAMPRHQQLGNS